MCVCMCVCVCVCVCACVCVCVYFDNSNDYIHVSPALLSLLSIEV